MVFGQYIISLDLYFLKKKTSDRRTERREQNQDESIIGTGGVLVIFQEKIVEHTVGNSHPVRSTNTTRVVVEGATRRQYSWSTGIASYHFPSLRSSL